MQNSGLPWILATTTFDLTTLTDAFGDALGEASGNVPLALGVGAAAAGLGLLAFAEAETILQVLGSAALVQFVSKKLLFAEDRKETIKQFEELLNTKVASKELVDDIQQIGKAILPALPVNNKGLQAPALGEKDVLQPKPIAEATDESSEAEEAPNPEPVAEATDVSLEAEEAPKPTREEVEENSLKRISSPLSPYPNYPNYKPPSSPTPSPS